MPESLKSMMTHGNLHHSNLDDQGMAPPSSVAAESEQKVWKAVSANPDSSAAVLVKKLEGVTARQMVDALNDLLAKDLVKAYKNSDGGLLWKAVNKADAKVKNAMAADERMVYSAIEASGNQGVWSRSIQSSTNLPTAVVTKILTKLVNSKQIKMVKSVKHPTRKMYMLSQIEPSVELTGGPWYTDFELDVEFIKTIKGACLKFIQTQSFPDPDDTSSSAALFSGSKTSIYPSTTDVAKWLRKSRITETELAPEHIQEVLDVLVYDGEVEKLPAFAVGGKNGNGASDDELDAKKSMNKKERGEVGKKRKRKSLSGEESDNSPSPRSESKKRKRRTTRKAHGIEDDSTSDPDALGDKRLRTKRKSSHKRGGRSTERESDGDDDPNSIRGKKKKSRKEARNNIDDEGSNSRKISKHRSERRHKAHASEDDTLSSNSETSSTSSTSDSDSNSDVGSRRSRSRSKPSKSDRKGKKKEDSDSDVDYDLEFGHIFGGDSVYRAIRQERVGLGWSQAPCAKCPQLDFCEDDGPVNPQGCKYYADWLLQGVEE